VIVVDANYFLRYLSQPSTAQDRAMSQAAATLFRLVRAGRETFTTTDAVIAEVVFILSSKRHYNVPRADVAALLRPILQLRGCKLPRKRLCLAALDLWASSPRLSFVDALGAVHARQFNVPLASFDADLTRVPGVALWQPPSGTGPT
jgi:predicted nucleic acid-binding protein